MFIIRNSKGDSDERSIEPLPLFSTDLTYSVDLNPNLDLTV